MYGVRERGGGAPEQSQSGLARANTEEKKYKIAHACAAEGQDTKLVARISQLVPYVVVVVVNSSGSGFC